MISVSSFAFTLVEVRDPVEEGAERLLDRVDGLTGGREPRDQQQQVVLDTLHLLDHLIAEHGGDLAFVPARPASPVVQRHDAVDEQVEPLQAGHGLLDLHLSCVDRDRVGGQGVEDGFDRV
jgi:hypothetical protein